MNNTVRLGRDYYSRTQEILAWLRQHIGVGHYYDPYQSKASYVHPDQALWKWEQMFGQTTIEFKREEDFVQFKLSWC